MVSAGDTGDLIGIVKITGHGDHQMRGPVTVGRDPRADEGATVQVDGDPLVSKSHLCLDIDQGDLIITDLGSSNGTFLHHVAGETAVPSDRWIPIPAGAEIEFGDQRMTIERVPPAESPDPEAHTDSDDAPTIEHAAQPVAPISDSFWATESAPAESAVASTPAVPPSPHVAPAPTEAPQAAGPVGCVQCGRELPPRSKFCDGCGMPVMPAAEPEPVVDHADHTVVLPPGGFAPGVQPPAPQPASTAAGSAPQYGGPAPQYGGPAPQYGGPPAHASPQGPPPGQYGQPSQFPPGSPGIGSAAQPAGGLVFVDPTAAKSKRGVGRKILLAIVALVVLGLIVLGLVTLLGGGDESSVRGRGEAFTVPTELDELWSTGVNGTSGFPSIGDSAVYVASQTDTDALFTSLSRDDGDQNWETTIDDADFGTVVGEFGDVAVVSACSFDVGTVCAAIGLDIADGNEMWRESLADGFALASNGRLLAGDGEGLALLDPATGDRLERVRGEVEFGDFNALLIDDDGDVSAYDDDLGSLIGPIEVDDESVAVAFDGERLLVAIGDEIVYVDAAGDVVPGPFLDGDITRLVAIDDTTLIAELGDEVVVYDLDGNDAVERWAESGTMSQVASADGGAVVIIDAGATRLVVDLVSGAERFDVEGDVDSIFTFAATNAFVVLERGDDQEIGGVVTVTTYDWITGDEIWSEDVEGAVRVDEVVVVVETDGDVIVFG